MLTWFFMGSRWTRHTNSEGEKTNEGIWIFRHSNRHPFDKASTFFLIFDRLRDFQTDEHQRPPLNSLNMNNKKNVNWVGAPKWWIVMKSVDTPV